MARDTRDTRVRPLRSSDVPASAALHLDVLGAEFLARGGEKFLRRYHAAWLASPFAMTLGAVDEDGQLLGALLGTVSPRAHYQRMFRDHGAALALALLERSVLSPRFGFELLATRGVRYARAVALQLVPARRGQAGPVPTPGRQVGEVTHLMVAPEAQGKGVGRALVEEAERVARAAGLDELVLVTPPDLPARQFYEHLGWQESGELRSRSGEVFVRYRLSLGQ
ncbi:MAG: GNAT family N-acetyltransferase [Acidimicrobiales bacterium]